MVVSEVLVLKPAVLPPDLPDHLRDQVDRGASRAAPQPNDCVMLIKQFIGSERLAQRPLLVLTGGRANMVNSLVPTEKCTDYC